MVPAKKNREKRAKSVEIEKHMFKYGVFLPFPAASTRLKRVGKSKKNEKTTWPRLKSKKSKAKNAKSIEDGD